jgi:F-type H+-transporting ATPase subunit a
VAITPDEIVYWQWGPVVVNATLVNTWIVMALLVVAAWLATRRVTADLVPGRWQNALEAIVGTLRDEIREISQDEARRYLPFVGTLFLLIAVANILSVVPGFNPPTGSLSTTAALAACVFVAVPAYGIAQRGVRGYFAQYVKPTPIMLPFTLIGEFSRTLALAVRLFGNIMSGTLIVGVLLSLAPLFFPVVMQAFGLLIGLIQAYIFAVLAMVYIASAARRAEQQDPAPETANEGAH